MPVSATSKATTDAAVRQNRMVLAPSALGDRDGEPHAALLGELEGVRQQVLEHLLQTLRVGDQAAREVRIGVDLES